MPLRADLKEFVVDHRRHGALTGGATESAWNGYMVTGVRPCGGVFGRWITPEDAGRGLLSFASLN